MSAISSLCRTCMANVIDNTEEDVFSYNIFETEGLVEKLMLCTNIEIQPYDEYPPHVCNTCCINILDFCDFQEMCRESLEKFSKMLEKQTPADICEAKILRDNTSAVVSKEHPTNTIEIESEDDFSDHEMILGDQSIDKPTGTQDETIEIPSDYDSNEAAGDDPLTGTKDCIIVEAIRIARRDTMVDCEHDYSQSDEAAIVRPMVVGGDKSEDEQGDNCGELTGIEDSHNLEYNNMLQIICSVDETPLCFNPLSIELNPKMIESVCTDDDEKSNDGSRKTEVECVVSIEEDINEEIHLFEDLPVNEETFSEINVVSSDTSAQTLPLGNTAVTKLADLSIKNAVPDKMCVEDDEAQLYGVFSDERDVNKTQLENVGSENEEECIVKDASEDKDAEKIQLENDDCEKEEECIFEDFSEDEDTDKKRLEHVSEDEANEDYLFDSPSEDEEIFSDSDNVLSDRKPKTAERFSCDVCPQTFILEQRLIAHKRRHQGLGSYPCPRENCSSSFRHISELQRHINDHNGIPRDIYKCDLGNCGLEYTTKPGLIQHMRKCHNFGPALPVQKFVCETCGKIYKYAHGLRVHQYIHVDESLWPFKCDVEGCGKRFRSNENYKIHKNRHNGIKPYVCTYCDKRFCSTTNLQAHTNFHTLAKKWTCNFCPRVFYTPANLRLHIRIKHENNPDAKLKYPCRFCNKILCSRQTKKSHERKHTGERPFVCEICGRSYTQRYSLKNHMQTHSPDEKQPGERENKFQCSVCNRCMSTAINLKYHEMKHTGEKPFECDVCGVRFRYQSNFIRHKKQKLCRIPKIKKDNDADDEDCIEISLIDANVQNNVEDIQ